jgi:hypothetical protein
MIATAPSRRTRRRRIDHRPSLRDLLTGRLLLGSRRLLMMKIKGRGVQARPAIAAGNDQSEELQ